MDLNKIIQSLHPLEKKVIPFINEKVLVSEIERKTGMQQVEIMRALQWLASKEIVILEAIATEEVNLTSEGEKYRDKGLPEVQSAISIINGSKSIEDIAKDTSLSPQEIGKSIGVLKSANILKTTSQGFEVVFSAEEIRNNIGQEEFLNNRDKFLDDDRLKSEFSKRGIIKISIRKNWKVIITELGKKLFSEDISGSDFIERLDSEMIKDGNWKGKEFRRYDINIDVPIQGIGRRHPMIESNNILRDIFIEMGFCEMEGPIVESEFWCFDALWIPQDHPARDEQDTFFLEGLAKIPIDYAEKVKLMHEKGIKKSHTPEGNFSMDITRRRILRTHSTATSFRYLCNLGKALEEGKDIDGKYFYCAHNFRNEAVDATHLFEFFQAEGFIIADKLSLSDLMGFIKEYYSKLGIDKIRFKPTFNPYTEPSMEAHYYDEKMRKWYALINSGIFRVETLKPFGLENKRIIAWGMGASRVAALLTGAESMRDITGATCDLEWLRTRPNITRNILRK